jgi:hypothetical protein
VSVEEDTFGHRVYRGVHESASEPTRGDWSPRGRADESLTPACTRVSRQLEGRRPGSDRSSPTPSVTVSVKVTLNHALSKATDSSLAARPLASIPCSRGPQSRATGRALTWRRVSGTKVTPRRSSSTCASTPAQRSRDLEDVVLSDHASPGVARDEAIGGGASGQPCDLCRWYIAAHVRTSPTGLSVRLHGTVRSALRPRASWPHSASGDPEGCSVDPWVRWRRHPAAGCSRSGAWARVRA